MIWVPLLLLGAPDAVALYLEEVGELPPAEARRLLDPLASLVEEHTGGRARWVEPIESCRGAACLPEILAQGAASRALSIRVFGGPKRIHLRFELLPDGGVAEVNVAKDYSDRGAQLRDLLERLLPPAALAPPEPPPPSLPLETVESRPLPVVPLALAGGAVLAAGVGIGFGLASQSAADTLAAGPLPASQHQGLAERQDGQALAANLCFAVAGTALAGALITWLLEL